MTPSNPIRPEDAMTIRTFSLLTTALAFLIGPVSAAIAGVFLDDVAARVEARSYPDDATGRALPFAMLSAHSAWRRRARSGSSSRTRLTRS